MGPTRAPSLVMPAASDTGYPLLRWFSLASLAALGTASVLSALLISSFLAAQLLRHDAELSRDFVQSIVTTQAVVDDFRAAASEDRRAAFAEFLDHVGAMPDVLRTNVYGMDREVLWSTDPALIGQRFARNEELDRALAGELVIEHGTVAEDAPLAKAEHARLRGSRFVENYLPIRDESRSEQIGVVELYRVPRGLNAILRESTLLVWVVTLAGGLLLYVSTLGIVRRASTLMRQQHARLAETEALAVIGEVAATTAHSIRNPLASIRSTAELQRELGALSPEATADTVRDVERIERLVRTLLTYARGQAEPSGRADAATVLRDAAEPFAVGARARGQRLSLELDAGLPAVRGDAVLLGQVLSSLLSNAVEAAPDGGAIGLRARREPDCVCIEIDDDGPGIAPALQADVFRPFFTTKPRGLGMGLALARRVVERLGGSLELRPRLPHGTRALLRLPLADEH